MSWYRDSDGKIITDEEFQSDCCECSAFCSEGTITIPCNGERTDCPHFKEVDTSDYDKEIRNKAIDEFAEKLNEKCNSMIADKWNSEVAPTSWANAYADFKDDIDEIARQMKEAGE